MVKTVRRSDQTVIVTVLEDLSIEIRDFFHFFWPTFRLSNLPTLELDRSKKGDQLKCAVRICVFWTY